jgi:hypothetical protein
MCPFLLVDHPIKGLIPGPYAKIESDDVRKLFLDVVSISTLEASGNDDELAETVRRVIGGVD